MMFLYQLIITPVELLIESVFDVFYRAFHDPGLAIVSVSLLVNFLVLPLYKRADEIQAEERAARQEIDPWVKHIRRSFRGDERFMMLNTLYRQQGYSPVYSLRSSLSLLLQVPFFIAAYHFLSHLGLLSGASFLFIRDLGREDALLVIGGIAVNILPVAMTAINIISGMIYTKDAGLRDRIQLYLLALLFLVLLYHSPAGLVMYWTLNNIFSLLKNVFMKIIPFKKKEKKSPAAAKGLGGFSFGDLIIWALVLVSLIGLLIPSALIVSSPEEFFDRASGQSPLVYVVSTFLITAGVMLVWYGGVICSMILRDRMEKMAVFTMLCALAASADYFLFGGDLGNLSSLLIFDVEPHYTLSAKLINLGVLIMLITAALLLAKRHRRLLSAAGIILASTFACMSAVNRTRTADVRSRVNIEASEPADGQGEKIIRLSKTGKNVIVMMLDRAISGYVPYIFHERPELKEKFSGFTYYPNTTSYGRSTFTGTPGLFGGYEYIPEEINKRAGQSLYDKHMEALKVMPVMFLEDGFDVTVCDPPYAGFQWVPDLSIYDDHPGIRAFNTEGAYMDSYSEDNMDDVEECRRRQFFCYGIFRSAPVLLQNLFYDKGKYYSIKMYGLWVEYGEFLKSYSVLTSLPDITDISDSYGDTFLMLQNSATHEPVILQLPDYTYSETIDNTGLEKGFRDDGRGNRVVFDTKEQMEHYHADAAAFLRLGEWFDVLRKNGVYDNTRIIIVSDHGRDLGQFDYMRLSDDINVEICNSLMLVKDFGSEGFSESDDFMTLADVPYLASDKVIKDPVNPFTGKRIENSAKNEGEQLIVLKESGVKLGEVLEVSGNEYTLKKKFYVKDNIFDAANWRVE